MDPLFGLPAMKDSKAMDAARSRNKSQERRLLKTVETLDSELKSKYCRVHSDVSELHQFLVDIDPNSKKTVIYPKGLTDKQRKEYKELRRGSMPSMSLEEFDTRLEIKRQEKRAHRPKHSKTEVTKPKVEQIVDVDVHTFCAPIHKHRQTMREAYDRATSSDVKFSDVKQEVTSKNGAGREGSHRRRGSNSSGGSLPYPSGFNPEKRRNTVGGYVGSERQNTNGATLDPKLVEMLRSKLEAATFTDSSDEGDS